MDVMAGAAGGPRFGQRFAVDGQIGANGGNQLPDAGQGGVRRCRQPAQRGNSAQRPAY